MLWAAFRPNTHMNVLSEVPLSDFFFVRQRLMPKP